MSATEARALPSPAVGRVSARHGCSQAPRRRRPARDRSWAWRRSLDERRRGAGRAGDCSWCCSVSLANIAYALVREPDVRPIGAAMLAGLSLRARFFCWRCRNTCTGYEINGIIHRSFVACGVLFAVGRAGARSSASSGFLGRRPRRRTSSRYPLILLPVIVALVAYALLLANASSRTARAS